MCRTSEQGTRAPDGAPPEPTAAPHARHRERSPSGAWDYNPPIDDGTRSDDLAPEISDADLRDLAAMEFEPWDGDLDQWSPPTAKDWPDIGKACLPGLTLAWAIVRKTKPRLVDAMRHLSNEERRALLDQFDCAGAFFKAMASIVETAEARTLSAIAAVAVGGEQGVDET